jgi:hypothetical protein
MMSQPEATQQPAAGNPYLLAFWEGLSTPTLPSVIGSLLVALLAWCACLLFLTEERLAVSPRHDS